MAIGAAAAGLRPVVVHQRFDFLLYATDQIVNWMGPWRFISGGHATMPVTIRTIVGKGWDRDRNTQKVCMLGSLTCPDCRS